MPSKSFSSVKIFWRPYSRAELVERLKERVRALAEVLPIKKVVLFGSWATGRATAFSDIDLLVEMEPGRTLLDHARLLLELDELLGRRVDVVSDRGIKPRIRERVLREAEPL